MKSFFFVIVSVFLFSFNSLACPCNPGPPAMSSGDNQCGFIGEYDVVGCAIVEKCTNGIFPDSFFQRCVAGFDSPPPTDPGPGPRGPKLQCGSVVNVDNLSVGESVPVLGTQMSLNYMSDRVIGRSKEYTITFPLLEPTDPGIGESGVVKVIVENIWDGQSDVTEYLPGSVSDFSFTWDGKNRLGVDQMKPLEIDLILKYEYADGTVTQRSRYFRSVGNYNPRVYGFGGWTLNEHHFLDVDGNRLYRGDGSTESIFAFPVTLNADGSITKFERITTKVVSAGFTPSKKVSQKLMGTHYLIAAKDGERAFIFNQDGTHFETRSAKTNAVLYSFSYDLNNQLTSITDSYGRQILINRPTTSTVEITSFGGKVTSLNLDTNGYTESVVEPAGSLHEMSYLAGGLLNTYKDPKGKLSTFLYLADGRLKEDRNNTGFKSIYTILNELENFATIEHRTKENRVTTFFNTFDEFGGVIRNTTNPSGSSDSFQDTSELSTTTTSKDGFSQTVTYDKSYRFEGHAGNSSSTDILTGNKFESIFSNQTSTFNDSDFLVLEDQTVTRTFDGRDWTETYDGSLNRKTFMSPLGRLSTYTTNDFNQVTQEVNASFLPVDYAYDAFGRLSTITQGTRVWTYAYNTEDELVSITNPLNQVTSFSYDDNSRPTEINNSGRITLLDYDGNGNITGVKPPGKPFHRFVTELFNEVRKYFIPSVDGVAPRSEVNYTYDDDYRLTKIERPNGEVIDYNYQAGTGYLKTIDSPEGRYTRNYDQTTDQLRAAIHPTGIRTNFIYEADLLKIVSNTYNSVTADNFNLYNKLKLDLKRLRLRESNTIINTRYLYDDDDLLRRVGTMNILRHQDSGLVRNLVLNQTREFHDYTEYGELRTRRAFLTDQTELFKEVYVRDDLGRIRIRRETKGNIETKYRYVYDAQGKLRRTFKDDIISKEYLYDANGNRLELKEDDITTKLATYDRADRILTYGDYAFTHDDFGNQTAKINTNPQINSQIEYDHDSIGALTEVRKVDNATSTVTDTISYINDGLGRRLIRMKNGVFTNRYIYNEDIRIEGETNEDGTSLTQYIYGTRINVPDYFVRDGVRYKIISDYVGSVRMVINAETNAVVQEIEYDDFGRVLSDTNPGFQPFYFAGGLYDVDTKLTRFGAREYDAEIGRWISVDPIRFDGGTTNLYEYSYNDSINFFDRSGRDPGDRFSNIDNAGRDSIEYINKRSINENREYGGWIYRNNDGSFSYTPPKGGTSDSYSPDSPPAGACGDYHTHGGYDPGYDNENFSTNDILSNIYYNIPGYLGTPSGAVRKYNPGGKPDFRSFR